jgi:CO/xanthine dehydrogenase FAD-binding subunit
MKPAPFEYSRPSDIDEACAMLAADDGARVIAGGQTLVPLMAMRLARPTRLIDIARISGLSFIREQGASVVVGAATKQHVVENDPVIRTKVPLLAKVMPYVGHSATRARGTVGGSIANGDAAAEIVLVAVTLEATLIWRENGTDHEMPAADFFLGPMVTSLPLAACLKSVSFPVWQEARVGVGFTRSTRGRAILLSCLPRRSSRSMPKDGAPALQSVLVLRRPCRCVLMASPTR